MVGLQWSITGYCSRVLGSIPGPTVGCFLEGELSHCMYGLGNLDLRCHLSCEFVLLTIVMFHRFQLQVPEGVSPICIEVYFRAT